MCGHSVGGYNVGLDISSDGNLVCSGSDNGKILIFNWKVSIIYFNQFHILLIFKLIDRENYK